MKIARQYAHYSANRSPQRRSSGRQALVPILLMGVIGGLIFSGGPGAAAAGDPEARSSKAPRDFVELQILAFNDYHGHLEAKTPGDVDGQPAGGSQYLSTALAQLRAGKENTLTVAAGDLIGASPALSSLFHDEPSVDSLNAMGLDVSSVGNHEFDEGVTELLRMQYGGCHPGDGCYIPGEPYRGAAFPWLAANVVKKGTSDTVLPPYWIKKVDGIRVGFIGMTLEATDTLVLKSGIKGYKFRDVVKTANKLVPELKHQGVETIIVLLHEGATQDPAPGNVNTCNNISGPVLEINSQLDPEIDAVISGHTHQPYNCRLAGPDGKKRMVTSAFSFGRVITEMTLVLDPRTGDVRRGLSSVINHPVIQSELQPDPALTAVIEKWMPLYEDSGNTPIGKITADIDRGGDPPGSDRGVPSPAVNLAADSQLWGTSYNGAQIAFMNPGAVRSDLTYSQAGSEGDGVVTYGEAHTFQPFGNDLVTLPMTGAQIISALEDQCQPEGSSRPFLALGVSDGFSFTVRRTIADGNCTSVSITNAALHGEALDPAAVYRVTVNSFLARGGDNFDTFAQIPESQWAVGGIDISALTDYMAAHSPISPPPLRVTVLP